MKLKFGKKTLALLLMLTVALSLCTVSAWAEDEGGTTPPSETTTPTEPTTPSEPATPTTPAVTGITLNKPALSLNYGGSETLTATVTTDEGASTDVTWSSSAEGVATVSNGTVTAVKAGTATITATAGDKSATCAVTVSRNSEAKVTAIALKTPGDGTKSVPYGISEASVKSQLAKIQLTLTWDQGGTSETTGTWAVSSGSFNSTDMAKSYEFVPTITEATADACANSAKVTVGITKAKPTAGTSTINIRTITVAKGTSEDNVKALLDKTYPISLNNDTTKTFGIGSYSSSDSAFVAGCYADWATNISGNPYNDKYESKYTFTAKAQSNDYYELPDLTVTVNAVSTDFSLDTKYQTKALSATADDIDKLLESMYGEGLDNIYFTDISTRGGTLYLKERDNSLTEVEERTTYTKSEFGAMYFYPDGSGSDFEIDYIAYTDNKKYIEGTITITSDEFFLLTNDIITITDDEIFEFSADDILDAIDDFDGSIDSDDVDYVKFIEIPSSSNEGYLYYGEYEEGSKSNTKVSSSKSHTFYVDPSKSQLELDSFTYVPGKDEDVTIAFEAHKTSNKYITGVIRINVYEEADITITASKNASVSVDYSLFEEFFNEKYSKYDIAYIVFDGAPHSTSTGYLYDGSTKIKSPDGKKFVSDNSYSKGDYDFDTLTYMGGSKDNSTRATFEIYYYKSGSKVNTKPVTGTIDFVTGVAGASTGKDLTATLTASQTMPFADEINAFLKLQSDMDYMVFTDLPRTGKLVYNWGASGQTDVTANTAYYISGTNKLLLKNVTFVPGYTSSKSSNTVTFGYKAVSTKGKTVTGTFTITVSHAYVSAQFYDVTNYLYADSVDFLYNQKITTGTSATTFNPNGQVTRMEFVTFLYRAAGSPSVTGLTNKFTDVSATTHSYYYNAILWATANGITTGTSATTFNPTGVVTHSELLTFLYRYDVNYLRHSSTTGSLGSYSGWSSVATWAQTGAKWAAGKGILTDSTTPPASNGTRATVALWMHRMLTL